MSRNYAVHLCRFVGTLLASPGANKVECDRYGCKRKGWRWVQFPWGTAALCRPHAAEDVHPASMPSKSLRKKLKPRSRK